MMYYLIIFFFSFFALTNTQDELYFKQSKQLIIVLTNDWTNPKAQVFLFENNNNKWTLLESNIPAILGENGLGLGLGLHDNNWFQNKNIFKKEGDKKAPAGVFTLGKIYGYENKLPFKTNLPYEKASDTLIGVDDIQSKYYNQIIDTVNFPNKPYPWNSYELMKRDDNLYKWLIVINHNEKSTPGEGSLIFFHIWRHENAPTVGCTAVSEKNILKVLNFIDNSKNPLLIQLPLNEYKNLIKRFSFLPWSELPL